MNKKDIKHIREIAKKLPTVYQQVTSGVDIDDDGKLIPNTFNHPINHERRLTKAYKSLGMDGIRAYLDNIADLQQKRREFALENKENDKHQQG